MSEALASVFSPSTRRVIGALVEALLAREGEAGDVIGPDANLRERVVAQFDDWAAHTSGQTEHVLAGLVWLLELLPVSVGRFGRMSSLPLAARVDYLERVERMKFGLFATALIGLKIPLIMVAYEEGELLRATGFDRRTLASRRTLATVGASR